MVIIDTNIIIDYMRQPKTVETIFDRFLETIDEDIALSVITIQELFTGESTRSSTHRERLLEVVDFFEIIPYTTKTAQTAGELVRDTRPRLSFTDGAIAATALIHDSSLLTLNHKDFASIPNLRLYKLD